MKHKSPDWSNYYAIFLVRNELDEEYSELIASAMNEDMAVDYAKYLSKKYQKEKNVSGLYVRKLFGDIVFAHTKETKKDDNTKSNPTRKSNIRKPSRVPKVRKKRAD